MAVHARRFIKAYAANRPEVAIGLLEANGYLFGAGASLRSFPLVRPLVVGSLCDTALFVVADPVSEPAEDAPISLCSLFALDRPVVVLGPEPLLMFWATTGPAITKPAPIRVADSRRVFMGRSRRCCRLRGLRCARCADAQRKMD